MNATNRRKNLYHYRECGLDNVWLEGGFEKTDSPYGPGVMIADMEGLHKCIAHCLIKKPGQLTGAEFRFLRTELDLSQFSTGEMCGRNERTVREWETRDSTVDEPANQLIRFIYEQRFDPSANYEETTKRIKRLQALDKQFHEMKLKITKDGWQEDCSKAA